MHARIARLACAAGLLLPGLAAEPSLAFGQGGFLSTVCPQVYDPVCARKKKAIHTYANGCLAANDRALVLARDICPEACPMIYKPVCATDGDGIARTYGNECAATAAGAKMLKPRRC